MEKTDIIVTENRHLSGSGVDSNILTTVITNEQNSTSMNNKNTFDMNELLREAQVTCHHIINTQIVKLLQNSKGVAFVKLLSLGVGDIIGNGILMKHNASKKEWYGPCAINMSGISMGGAVIGVEEIHSVLIINDEHFFSALLKNNNNNENINNNTMIGNDVTITTGKLPENNDMTSNLPKIISYSFSKGACIDFGFEKAQITINNKVNHQYHQKSVDPEDIFNGNIKPSDNQHYFELCQQLTTCVNIDGHKMNVVGQQPQRFELSKQSPLYQYYVENDTKHVYSYQQLLQLPVLPFIDDINKKNYKLTNTKGWVLGKKIYRRLVNFFHFMKPGDKNEDNKTDDTSKFMFDANMPLYQYYTNNKCIEYDFKQLNNLPKFPFLNDVRNYHSFLNKIHSLRTRNKHHRFSNKIHPMHKSNKDNNNDTNKYVFDELIPLYQYYIHNENAKELKYNYQILLNLPKFPYLNDIKSNKFRLKQYNPVHIIKKKIQKFRHQKSDKSMTTKWYLDANIPLRQYYMNDKNEPIYDYKQLSSLPTLPFLHDVKTQHFKLAAYSPIDFIKKEYKKYISSK